jgi:hypothetical protein
MERHNNHKNKYSNQQSNTTFQPQNYRQSGFEQVNAGRTKTHSSSTPIAPNSQQPLVGIIDQGFGAGEHGAEVVKTITQSNPQSPAWLGGGVGNGNWTQSLTKLVDTAKTLGRKAIANLSFDLTEKHLDGSVTTRSQLTTAEQQALSYAHDNGVLIVASSGNQGGTMSALGQASEQFDNIITVGAVEGKERATYSSYGNGLDLVASGSQKGGSFTGTSRSAAEVTSTISKMWTANPTLNYHQITLVLESTATDLQKPGWDAETGAGLLNKTAAVNLAKVVTPKPQMFSGAQLMQQINKSSKGSTWKSTNGTVASEQSAGVGDWLKDKVRKVKVRDIGHIALDAIGTFDPTPISDGLNAAWYLAEGDKTNAAISAAAMLPYVGDTAKVAKYGAKGLKAAKAAKKGDEVIKAAGKKADAADISGSSATAIRTKPPRTPVTKPSRTKQEPLRGRSGPKRGRSMEATPQTFRRNTHSGNVRQIQRQRSRSLDNSNGPGRSNVLNKPQGPSRRDGTSAQAGRTHAQLKESPKHQIRRGDTLWKIAKNKLGSGARWRELRKPDGSRFTEQDARRLQPGELVIAPKAKSVEAKPPAPLPRTPSPRIDASKGSGKQSPWTPRSPEKVDPLFPHIRDTRDYKYAQDPQILSRLAEIRQGESLSEFAKRIKTRVWDKNGVELTGPNQPPQKPPTGGNGSHSGNSGSPLNPPSSSRNQSPGSVGTVNSPYRPSKPELDAAARKAEAARDSLEKTSKTIAQAENNQKILSGWARDLRRQHLVEQVESFMHYDIEFQDLKSRDGGYPGRHKASHAERMAFIEEWLQNPDKPVIAIGVNRKLCSDGEGRKKGPAAASCEAFFQDAANVTGKTIVIADYDKGGKNRTQFFSPE